MFKRNSLKVVFVLTILFVSLILVYGTADAFTIPKIENGSFDDSTAPWTLGLKNGAVGFISNSSGWGEVDITSLPAASKSNVLLKQIFNADIVAGTTYTISFDIKADAAKTIDAIIYDCNDTIRWSIYNIAVPTTTKSCSYTFTPSASYAGAYLGFRVGGENVDIYFDNICVSSSTANLITNGGFGGIATPWTMTAKNEAAGNFVIDNGCGKVDIAALPTPSKDNVILSQTLSDTLFSGKTYTVAFSAKADAAKNIDAVIYNSAGVILWSQVDITVGTTFTNYSYTYTPNAKYDGAYLAFRVGGENVDIYFDNISVNGDENLTWPAPALANPTTINLGTSDTVPTLTSGMDYIINLPSSVRTKRVNIAGGRNVVIIGGQVNIADSPDMGFYIHDGDPNRIVHIEGVLVTTDPNGSQDAFEVWAPNTIVQIENCRVEHLKGGVDATHADVLQPFGGSKEIRIDHLSASSNYQGFFLIANQDALSKNSGFTFKNVNLLMEPEWYTGASGGCAIWLDNGLDGAKAGWSPTRLFNFYVQQRSGNLIELCVQPDGNPASNNKPVVMNKFLTWPTLSGIVTGGIHEGAPSADFVPSGAAGIGYVSPGYNDTAIPVPQDIIIDNTDSGCTFDSSWSASTATSGYYGSNYVHDGTTGADTLNRWAKWTPNVLAAGNYQVYMRWTAATNRPDAAPLEIAYNGGTDTSKTVNQQTNNGTWVLIGTYNLSEGTSNYVKILATDIGYTTADAVKFVYAGQ